MSWRGWRRLRARKSMDGIVAGFDGLGVDENYLTKGIPSGITLTDATRLRTFD